MIKAWLIGDEQVKAILRAIYPKTIPELINTVRKLTIELEDYIKTNKVKGPRPEHIANVTGTLERKIHSEVETSSNNVTGIVGLKLAYAAIHEYGYEGVEHIKEHYRTITQAFGRDISPVTFPVRAHDREMHMPERSYLRSGLQDKREYIISEIEKTFRKVVMNG